MISVAAIAAAPSAAATRSICSYNPTVDNEVCCSAPSNPTTQFACNVEGDAKDYATYVEGVAFGTVASAQALAHCLVYEQPVGSWLTKCIVIN